MYIYQFKRPLGECISDNKKKRKLRWLYHNKIIKVAHSTFYIVASYVNI